MDELSSDSESDVDDDSYETIYLDCPTYTPLPFVSTSARIESTAQSTSGVAHKEKREETENVSGGRRVTDGVGWSRFRNVDQCNKDPLIVIWRSYNSEQEEPTPEVHRETDHVTESVSLTLPCLEEVPAALVVVLANLSFQDDAREKVDHILSRTVVM